MKHEHESGAAAGVRLLLIDTCSEAAGVALAAGDVVVRGEAFTGRLASVTLIAAVRRLLAEAAWRLSDLAAVGVVSGPGSFTGVRVGMAAAMGLCEAAGLRLLTVSRLALLAEASLPVVGVAVLDAGGGSVYVADGVQHERRVTMASLVTMPAGIAMLCAEQKLADALEIASPQRFAVHVRPLTIADALAPMLRALSMPAESGSAANYVQLEHEIYGSKTIFGAAKSAGRS